MLLTTGEYYEVAFRQTNDAAWTGFAIDVPAYVTDKIVTAATFMILVTDDASGSFVFEGGSATGFDDALILGSATGPLTNLLTTDSSGSTMLSGLGSDGTWWVYRQELGFLVKFDAGESTALKAFLP